MRISTQFLLSIALTSVPCYAMNGTWDWQQAGDYILYQDLWGSSSGVGHQSSHVIKAQGNDISWSTTWEWEGMPSQVKSYANAKAIKVKGTQLSAIKAAQTSWNWHYRSIASGTSADVSYDMFTGDCSSGSTAFEIMIWLSAHGCGPIGSLDTPKISIAGHTWDLYSGPIPGQWEVFSFVSADGDLNQFNADLNSFFKYLTGEKGVPASQCLFSIQAGTEAFVGSATLVTDQYSVTLR